MRTVFNLAIVLLSAFVASAEHSTYGAASVFGIRGGGLFGGKEKSAVVDK
jgi:hypothetical protein